jgi:small membrane protein
MHYYRIIVALIVALAAWRILVRFRQGHLSTLRALGWLGLWVAALVLSLFPWMTDRLSQWAGIERGSTLFFFFSILFLVYIIFNLHVRIDRLQRELTDLVRALALRDAPPPGPADSPNPKS